MCNQAWKVLFFLFFLWNLCEASTYKYRLKVALSDWRFKAKLTGNETKTLLQKFNRVREILESERVRREHGFFLSKCYLVDLSRIVSPFTYTILPLCCQAIHVAWDFDLVNCVELHAVLWNREIGKLKGRMNKNINILSFNSYWIKTKID